MTNHVYKNFKTSVENADQYSDVWYAGYLWMDLTPRQSKEIDKILRTKGFINQTFDGRGKWHTFPNGLMFRQYED